MTAEQIYAYALFSDPQEQLAAVLGKDAAKEFFSTGKLGEGFAVLSDRRLYFRGVCLLRRGHRYTKCRTERTVDVADITDFRLVTPAPQPAAWFLLAAWTVLLSYGLIDFIEHRVIWGPVLLGLGLGFIGLLLWLIHRLRQRIFLRSLPRTARSAWRSRGLTCRRSNCSGRSCVSSLPYAKPERVPKPKNLLGFLPVSVRQPRLPCCVSALFPPLFFLSFVRISHRLTGNPEKTHKFSG